MKNTEKNRQRNIVNKKGVNFEHALQNVNCLISGFAGQVTTEDLNKLKRISSILNLRFGNFSQLPLDAMIVKLWIKVQCRNRKFTDADVPFILMSKKTIWLIPQFFNFFFVRFHRKIQFAMHSTWKLKSAEFFSKWRKTSCLMTSDYGHVGMHVC